MVTDTPTAPQQEQAQLDDMRKRDREAGALWFTGPESFTALAARDRRALLTMLAEAQIAVTWNANMLADAQAQLAALQRDHAASAARVVELEPAAECWAALSACARIKLMGCAGVHPDSPDFATPHAHIGLEFWTHHKAKGDAQDIQGRDWFCRFMFKALAAYRAALAQPDAARAEGERE